MELTTFNFWGKTKYWWGIMLVGILLIPAGLWLLFQPVMGYAVISMLLGWGLILFGVVQLTVSLLYFCLRDLAILFLHFLWHRLINIGGCIWLTELSCFWSHSCFSLHLLLQLTVSYFSVHLFLFIGEWHWLSSLMM